MIDGPLAPIPCGSQTASAPCKDCLDERTCAIRAVMKQVRDATAKILDETNLGDLLDKEKSLALPAAGYDFHIRRGMPGSGVGGARERGRRG